MTLDGERVDALTPCESDTYACPSLGIRRFGGAASGLSAVNSG